jgi:drug/metabolite transporter (DMT)-like permease
MARDDANFVAPLNYATLVFAAGYDAVFDGVRPDRATYPGAAIILTGALWLALARRT